MDTGPAPRTTPPTLTFDIGSPTQSTDEGHKRFRQKPRPAIRLCTKPSSRHAPNVSPQSSTIAIFAWKKSVWFGGTLVSWTWNLGRNASPTSVQQSIRWVPLTQVSFYHCNSVSPHCVWLIHPSRSGLISSVTPNRPWI